MLENGLFVLDRYEKQIQVCIAETKTQAMLDAELWHARFGHVGYGSLMTLQCHNMVNDLSLLEMPPTHVCEGCVLGKMLRFAFSQDGSVKGTRKLQLVHSDVCGPMRTPSVGNSLYFVTFIDDFSRFCWVYPFKTKSDVFAIFQHYVTMVENERGCKVQTLRTDRGGEYMSGPYSLLRFVLYNTCCSCFIYSPFGQFITSGEVVDVAGPTARIAAARSVLPTAEQAHWDVKDVHAHVLIALSVKRTITPHIHSTKSAKQAWDILQF
ncbi:hypothetical protein L7F22_018630 [Adiantum nelumboides]|nr:hypothetical protein [Adiantum nelumboides]